MKYQSKHKAHLPLSMRRFLIVLATAVSLCLGIELVCRFLHMGYPYDFPLLSPKISFWDFRAYFGHFETLHTVAFFEGPDQMMYPPTVVLLYRFFYEFQPIATPIFLAFILVSLLTGLVLAVCAMIAKGLKPRVAILFMGATLLLAYPFWFELKQGNMEIIVWILLGTGLWCVVTDRTWGAAFFFGLASAIKFYPIIYLGLLFSKKRYRECVFGCLVAAATLLVSLWFVGPTIPVAWHGMQQGLSLFRTGYMLVVRPFEIGYDHSTFAVIKSIVAAAHHSGLTGHQSPHSLSIMLNCYMATVCILGTGLYFFRIRYMPITNQVLCIVVASVLLPPVSFDYTLMHLFTPWLMMCFVAIEADQENRNVPGLRTALSGFAVSVGPLGEFIFHGERFGGEVRALVLLYLAVLGLRYPFLLRQEV